MKSVFVLQHLRVVPGLGEEIKMIGVYRSLAAAQSAVARLVCQPGFCEFPRIVNVDCNSNSGSKSECDSQLDCVEQGFFISEYPLDQDHWSEGFAGDCV